ncbi:MAG: ABC transporter substrate-binding protein, partial [Pacificimonas sp.]
MLRTLLSSFAALCLAACGMDGGASDERPIAVAFVADDGLGDRDRDEQADYATAAAHLGLTGHGEDGRIVPELATSWRVLDDGRTYVFKLRPAVWPDGREITSGDVVAVVQRALAPGSEVMLKPYLMEMAEADAVAANRKPPRMLGIDNPLPDVVTIELDRPAPALLELLAQPDLAIVRAREDSPPPSGPFAIAEDGAALVPNGRATDETVVHPLALSTLSLPAALEAFVEGDVDIVTGSATSGLSQVLADSETLGAQLRIEPTRGIYGLLAKTSSGPLADVRVRRALSMTVDRDALIDLLGAPIGMEPAFGPLAPTLPEAYAGAVPDWSSWTVEARATEAVRLLSEAGVTPRTPLSIDVAVPRGNTHEMIVATLAEGWRPYGINIRAYRRPPALHREVVEDGDYDLAISERIAPAMLPEFFLRPFSCDIRAGGYCNPGIDGVLAAAAEARDPSERVQLIRRAARLMA